MKNVIKIVLCSILALVLIAMLIWALVFQFELPFVLHLGNDFDDAAYTVMDAGGEIRLTDAVNALDVHWSSGAVHILSYEGDEIVLRESVQDNERDRLRYRIDNGRLIIRDRKHEGLVSMRKEVELLLPEKMAKALTTVELDLASAELTLDALQIVKLEVDTASGDMTATDCTIEEVEYDGASSRCTMKNCVVDEFDMDTASGSAFLTGSVSKVSFDGASADLEIVTSVTPRKIDVDTASGDVELTIPADSQFTLDYDSILEDWSISDFVGSFSGKRFVCGDGSAVYRVETASGELYLHAGK